MKLPRFLPFGVPSLISEPHHTALSRDVRTELCLHNLYVQVLTPRLSECAGYEHRVCKEVVKPT